MQVNMPVSWIYGILPFDLLPMMNGPVDDWISTGFEKLCLSQNAYIYIYISNHLTQIFRGTKTPKIYFRTTQKARRRDEEMQ